MALHACVMGNVVVEIVDVLNEDVLIELLKSYSCVIDIESEAVRPNVGWVLSGTAWTEGQQPPSSIKPITAKQIRLGLLGAGVSLESIDQAIGQMSEPEKSYAQVTWDYATIFEREHPMVESLGSQLGLTTGQIDQLFIAASEL